MEENKYRGIPLDSSVLYYSVLFGAILFRAHGAGQFEIADVEGLSGR